MSATLFNPYCSVEEVRSELRNNAPANDIEDTLIRAINSASRFIDNYTRRDFFLHDYSITPLVVDKWSGSIFGNRLFLPYSPVIGSVTVSNGVLLVADTDYSFRNGILYRIGGDWFAGEPPTDVIRLTGKFGYDQEPEGDEEATEVIPVGIPDEIRQAAILISAALSGHNQKEIVGLDGGKSSVIDKTIPKTVYDLLGSRGILI